MRASLVGAGHGAGVWTEEYGCQRLLGQERCPETGWIHDTELGLVVPLSLGT